MALVAIFNFISLKKIISFKRIYEQFIYFNTFVQNIQYNNSLK